MRPRTQHPQRRLAAILAADVAGYSRLIGADEDGTLARLKAHRRELLGPLISEHRGHTIQTTGDGLLIEFASAVEAVRCAVEMQRGMVDRNANLPESQHLLFRMGINLGDIIEDDGDLFGDGVNVAARLERLSEPGGLCIARSVRDQIRDKLPYLFEDEGEHQVKNIARPVRVFALRPSKITQTEAHAVQPASVTWGRGRSVLLVCAGLTVITGLGIGGGLWGWTASRVDDLSTRLFSQSDPAEPASALGPSIVLLPLVSVSPDAERNLVPDGITEDLTRDFEPDDFAEAIADDLTTGLSRISGLLVIARNTALIYKGKAVDVRQVGRDLGVGLVLEGTLRRSGDQVRLNARLSDARTGARLWVERIDGSLQRAGVLDDQITSRVAGMLGLQLVDAQGEQSSHERPTNLHAVEHAMRGWALLRRPRARDNTLQAAALFEDALKADPDSISASLGLGRAYYRLAVQRWADDPAQLLDRSEQLAHRAATLDPSNGRAHHIMSDVLQARKQVKAALVEVRRAVELDPSDAGAWGALGFQLLQVGRFAEVLEPLRRALQISPRDPLLWSWTLNTGLAHCALGNDALALEWVRRAVQANPQSPFTHLYLGAVASLMGRPDEARLAVAEYVRLRPEATITRLRHETSSDEPRYLALRERLYGGLRTAGLHD